MNNFLFFSRNVYLPSSLKSISISLHNWFFFLIVPQEMSCDELKITDWIKKKNESLPERYQEFDQMISDVLGCVGLPISVSGVIVYIKSNNQMYVKSFADGELWIQRDKKWNKIVYGGRGAGGIIQKTDLIVLTTSQVIEKHFNNEIHRIIQHVSVSQNEEKVTVALIIEQQEKINKEESIYQEHQEETSSPLLLKTKEKKTSILSKITERLQYRFQSTTSLKRKKLFVALGVILLLGILVWSIGSGSARRKELAFIEKVTRIEEQVQKDLTQAEEDAFLNISGSQDTLERVKKEYQLLLEEAGKNQQILLSLKNRIASAESRILKQEEKTSDEFYDFSLEEKGVLPTKLAYDETSIVALDSTKKKAYVLNVKEKSVTEISASEVDDTSHLSLFENVAYEFTSGKGISKSVQGKMKQMIQNDSAWKDIVDMHVYGGTIYLLDRGEGEILKYPVIEGGYGTKSAYFKKDEAIDLSDAVSCAIDGSIYISIGSRIVKYTSGVKDAFSTIYPSETVYLNKVIASPSFEKVYGWDKKTGTLYIHAKNGAFERQMKSSVLSKAEDVAVVDDVAYILSKGKLFSMDLK